MSNVISDIGHDIKVVAVDTAHIAEKIVGAIPKAIAVLSSALKDEAPIKAAVVGLVQEFGTLTADGTLAVASKGANLIEDAATITAAEAFLSYFAHAFVPAIEKLYADVKTDLI